MSATGLALLAVILHIWFGMHAGLILNGDMLEYHAIARHLMEQGYFGIGKRPGAYVTPAYPLFITLIYLLIHWSTQQSIAHCLTMTRQVYLIQQIVDMSIPWLCYLLAREFGGRWVGLAGCALSIAYLPNNFVGCKLLTEALYVPLLLASLLLLTKLRKQRSFSLALGAGAVVGLTILTRPLSAVILPVWIALIFVEEYIYPLSRPARTWRTALTVVASVTIVLCPWWIRNEVTLHRLVILSTEGGNPLLLGASPYFELGQYQLMTLAKSAHESLMAFSLHYILHGFRQRFWLYLGWYTVGRLPYYFLSPWLLGWWSNTLVFVYFHRLVVLLGLIARISATTMLPIRRSLGTNKQYPVAMRPSSTTNR